MDLFFIKLSIYSLQQNPLSNDQNVHVLFFLLSGSNMISVCSQMNTSTTGESGMRSTYGDVGSWNAHKLKLYLCGE